METETVRGAVESFFEEFEVASLKLPSGWFGRPHDNWHQLERVETREDLLTIVLDGVQVLSLSGPQGARVLGRTLRITGFESGKWESTEYGGTTRHEQRFTASDVEFVAP